MNQEVDLSKDPISVRTQYNIVLWILLTIWTCGLVIFVSRPFIFLTNGIITNIQPDTFFIFSSFTYVLYSYFIIFITGIFLVNQYKTRVAKIIYIIFGCICCVLSLVLIVQLTIYASNCNKNEYPTNPCNSEFFCCEFGSSVKECGISLYISPNCGLSLYSLINLNGNSTFIEFFVWIFVFLIIQTIIIYTQSIYIDELSSMEEFADKEHGKNDLIGKRMGLYNKNVYNSPKSFSNDTNGKDFIIMKIDNDLNLENQNLLHLFMRNGMAKLLNTMKKTRDRYTNGTGFKKIM